MNVVDGRALRLDTKLAFFHGLGTNRANRDFLTMYDSLIIPSNTKVGIDLPHGPKTLTHTCTSNKERESRLDPLHTRDVNTFFKNPIFEVIALRRVTAMPEAEPSLVCVAHYG